MRPFRNLALDRRCFLRGAGAMLALPWLEAMTPAVVRTPKAPPRRSVFVFVPNGQKMDDWTPTSAGTKFELPFLLAPFAELRDRVTVISGLAIDGGRPHGDGPGDHARSAGTFLTCAHPFKTGGADIRAGVSVDQVIAASVGAATDFPSLELGMEGGTPAGDCDSGYSCAYTNCVSWKTPTTPVAKETDPRAVFARLFGDPQVVVDAAAMARQRASDQSVLDAVLTDGKALQARLSAADQQKLGDYLQAVRELELRLQKLATDTAKTPLPANLLNAHDFPERLALMFELITLALATDRTRVITFMLGNAGSNRSYRFLEVPEGHHEVSHHGGKAGKLECYKKINRFHAEQFAAFLARLAAQREGDGDLLQHSAVVYGSGIGDGNRHNHDNLPVLLCGRSGGALPAGRHVQLERETPMANLHLLVMGLMGCKAETFADSTGLLDLG
jgi:hypothetical protein